MVQEIKFYSETDQSHNWRSTMHSQMSHSTVPQPNYGSGSYSYSPNIYNHSTFPYSNQSIQTTSTNPNTNGSPQDYQGFAVPPYQVDPSQFISTRVNVNPSGSSTADSNGSIVSEFDANQNPIKKRRKPAPTIATGRRNLKDESVNTEEADRRDKRRERNRKSAQRCRERKIEKKDELERQIMDTNIVCSRYLGLAENVLKAWKQRLHILNEKLPCNNYKSQLSVADFENLIDAMQTRKKDTSENGDSCNSIIDANIDTATTKHDYNSLAPQMTNTFITCNKIEPYYALFDNDMSAGVINSGFDQYHNCMPESNISYI